MDDLISIREAASKGLERLRRPKWANPLDHLKIDIIRGEPGPWTHLFAPCNLACNKRDPVDMICTQVDYDAKEWQPYTGALPDSDEYKAAVAGYAGCLSEGKTDAP